MNDLEQAIVKTIRSACKEMTLEFGDDRLFGFALCTDEDVMTLFSAACTQSWVREREGEYEGIGYIYTEWDQNSGGSHFDSASSMIATDARDGIQSTATQRFEAFVLAMQRCRNDGLFDPDTLLCCGSTDPSDEMEMLALEAVDRLNSADTAGAFAKHFGYEEYRDNDGEPFI